VNSAEQQIQLDFHRRGRTGLDEAVYSQSKTSAQLDAIFAAAARQNAPLLLTRLSPQKLASIDTRWSQRLDYCELSRTAFFGASIVPGDLPPARIGIVAAGSSDACVAREAERTLLFNGIASHCYMDVGVAGLWRLMNRLETLRRLPVIIAIAGMDAALPTVLGGLIGGMIIAVPTSVGYGVAAGGRAALHAILASCAPGITAVNIDNGYGAACAAMRALRVASAAADHSRTPAQTEAIRQPC
jgi:hypothetical protein